MKFIRNLVEARFFRYQDNFDGKRISDIATTLYLLLLLVEISRRFCPEYAQRYCKQTFTMGNFDGIRSYATDVHNLIAVLNNKHLRDKLDIDRTVHLPEFAIKRYLRDVMWGTREHNLNRSFFIQLSSDLGVTDPNTRTARRNIIDYHSLTPQEYYDTAERISRKLNDLAINCDLHWYYKTEIRSKLPHS